MKNKLIGLFKKYEVDRGKNINPEKAISENHYDDLAKDILHLFNKNKITSSVNPYSAREIAKLNKKKTKQR